MLLDMNHGLRRHFGNRDGFGWGALARSPIAVGVGGRDAGAPLPPRGSCHFPQINRRRRQPLGFTHVRPLYEYVGDVRIRDGREMRQTAAGAGKGAPQFEKEGHRIAQPRQDGAAIGMMRLTGGAHQAATPARGSSYRSGRS